MGQRANLLVLTGGECEFFYTHYRANTLDRDLFWGSEIAIGFIRSQQRLAEPQWLDEVWAEGGAVMDLDNRVLVWFGGEDILYDVPLRRAHHCLMSHLWSGWELSWAVRGVEDLTRYVGLPLQTILSEKCEPPSPPKAEVVIKPSNKHSASLGAISFGTDSVKASLLSCQFDYVLYAGEKIVEATKTAGWRDRVALLATDWFCGGFYLSVATKSLEFWNASPRDSVDIYRRVQSRWPNWSVRWHEDQFVWQAERAKGAIRFAPIDPPKVAADLRRLLLYPDSSSESGGESALEVAKIMSRQLNAKEISINPAALRDARLELPLETRTRIFNQACAAAGFQR